MGMDGCRVWMAGSLGDSTGVVFALSVSLSIDSPVGFSIDHTTRFVVFGGSHPFAVVEHAGESPLLAWRGMGILGRVLCADCDHGLESTSS